MSNSIYFKSPFIFFLLLFRASLDPILDLTKVSGIGFGAVLNFLLVIFFFAVCIIRRKDIPASFFKTWFFFLLCGIISVLISPDMIRSARSFFSVLTYYSLFCLPYYFINNKSDFKSVIWLIIFSSLIPFLCALFEFAIPLGSNTKDGFRLFGSFSHPNIFAFYLVLIISICFFSLKSNFVFFESKFYIVFKSILIFSVILLFFTKTRSAWISLVSVLFIYGILAERKFLIYLLLCIMALLLVPAVQDRISDLFINVTIDDLQYGEVLDSYSWRKLVWASSWDYIFSSPFFGNGYDTFSYYFLNFFPLQESVGYDAHNAYVQIAFDMGFLGVIGFLVIFKYILSEIIHMYAIDKNGTSVILGLIFSFLLVCYSDNMLFYLSYNWYFWFFIGSYFYFCKKRLSGVI